MEHIALPPALCLLGCLRRGEDVLEGGGDEYGASALPQRYGHHKSLLWERSRHIRQAGRWVSAPIIAAVWVREQEFSNAVTNHGIIVSSCQ